MSKFGNLAADVSAPHGVELVDPVTGAEIRDRDGNAAVIRIWSLDSARSRDYDRQRRRDLRARALQNPRAAREPDDQLEENIAKAAALTESWHLVDPASGETIDIACTRENAAELYAEPGAHWIFMQVWLAAANPANFMKRSSKSSSPSPSTASASTAG